MADFIAIDEIRDYIDKRINSLNTNMTDQTDAIIKYMQGGVKEFTSNGTFTVPAYVKKIRVDAVGGGAGGGAGGGYWSTSDYGAAAGGGGGAGEYVTNKYLNVTPNSTISVIIGSGGTGGKFVWRMTNMRASNGTNGTASIVNGVTIARGGYFGEGGEGTDMVGGSNRASVGSAGANYGTGMTSGTNRGIGGTGGNSGYSSYGRGGNGGDAGANASSNNSDGKNGSNGWVRISWDMGY